MEPPLWTEGASPWPHEREALAFVRTRLPNHEPYRAWTNVEFIAEDGSVNEVDLLAVTTRGLFLVEIKSWPGIIFGDGQRWRLKRPNGSEKTLDHPLLLANTKAKRLRSLLARQAAFKGEQPPWVTALVFLSSADLECRLHDVARTSVCGRDPEPVPGGTAVPAPIRAGFGPLPGIVAGLKEPGTLGLRGQAINKPLSAKIAHALHQAGLQSSNRGRRAGDWELSELLDEGPGWQDFLASRPRMTAKRRVRVYLAGAATTAEEEARLRRQAEREFRIVQDLRHDGIAQPLDLVQAERGPALLFDLVEGEERLDLWAPSGLDGIPLDTRIEFVRQLVEAVAHAHSKKITHRGLTSRSVLVRPGSAGELAQLVIGHWQAGARELATRLTRHPASTTGSALGTDLAERLDATEQVYLAPEAFSVEDPDGAALDVFSLGALAFLLLAGQPPAADLTEREAMLAAHQGLALDVAVDGLPGELTMLVAAATDPVPARRATVRELLDLLDAALDTLTAPAPIDVEPEDPGTADPLSAHQGDVLEGGWSVERRLGSGSTAVALLCRRSGSAEPEVLKVAKDEEHAERLRDEARSLEQLRHPGIVEFSGVERVGGRTSLRLAPAGDPEDKVGMTLADRIAAQGRLGLDLLERFGDDLLEVVAYLESEGVPHRDIKPDNLGVRPRRGDRSLHLVLFDFSLARTPDNNLAAGTPGYLDPFLSERPGRRWDPSADRYAAAATLHEMATGTRPIWGDGRTDPIHLDDEVPRLDRELLDPSVRDGLLGFFTTALHRMPANRYDTADQMRQAWRAAFAAAARPTTTTDEDRAADLANLEQLADAARLETPVAELGLSGAAASALERLGLGTVELLLAFPTAEWNRASGVGLQVRREVLESIGRLRSRFDADSADPAASIDRLAAQLIPKPSTAQAQADHDPLDLLLGLRGDSAQHLQFDGKPAGHDSPALAWPGPADLKARFDLDRSGYDALLERARGRWGKQPAVTQVRHDLESILERAGGVLSGDELALALLAQRGSTLTGTDRVRRARAVVRAGLETEASRQSNRFTWRRLGGGVSAVVALQGDGLEAEELADYAASLGVVADQLAGVDPLLSPAVALERLRQVSTPTGLPPLADHRIARLAAAASATAAVSSRFELYPRGMPAARALRLARAALLGAGTLSEEDILTRTRTRFPSAEALPDRPELDTLLKDTVGLEWFSGGPGPTGAPLAPGFRVPPPPAVAGATALTMSGGRFRTGTSADVPDEARAAAENAQDRLERHAKSGGFLVITIKPSQQQRAVPALADLGATPLSVDALIVGAMRKHAAAKGIKWDQAILAADADGPDGERWSRLLTVVRDALVPVRSEILKGPDHVLLTHPGLLARYDALGLLDELRERTTRQPEPSQTLRTLWILVPADDPEALPSLAGKAIPVTTSAEHFALPDAWLRNLHRTQPTSGGST